ncbi:MAG: flagellar hook-associated protein FlgK [Lachnospiraceae bacterium]|nr:flagellar hook-associated protein FlgK [Lachnospiraceae bacterium]
MGVGSMAGLYFGVSGFQVNQTALQTTSHNLSNLDTDGYVRQQVIMKDTLYDTLSTMNVSATQLGHGTSMDTIRQVRDIFADKQYRLETGRGAFYGAMEEVGKEVETYFGADVDDEKLKNTMTSFWETLNELQKTPDSIVNRETVIQSAQEMIEQSKLIYNQIIEYQRNLNEQIQQQVDRINEIAEEIHNINRKITGVESGGIENANDLRDSRNLLLDELATYGEINYREDVNGCVTVNLEGIPLVVDDRTFKVGTSKINEGSDLLEVVWADHANMPVFNFAYLPSAETSTDVGSLKGLIYARGSYVGDYTLMNMETSQAYLNKTDEYDNPVYVSWEDFFKGEGYMGDTVIPTEDDLKEAYAKFYEKEVEPYLITNVEAQLDYLMHNIVTTVNDILCPNKELDAAIMVTDEEGNSYTLPKGTIVLDLEKAPVGLGDDGLPGEELFVRTSQPRYNKYTDDEGNTVYVYNTEDSTDKYKQYTIGQIEVNDVLIKNPSKLPLSDAEEHSNRQDVINDLLDAWSSEGEYEGMGDDHSKSNMKVLTPNTLTGFNFQGYYNAMIGDLSNTINCYYNVNQNQITVGNQLDDRRQTVAGVNSDEELTNMIMFQQAFNACSRYINVVADMLDTLINRTGRG